jgi:hypothetical protein
VPSRPQAPETPAPLLRPDGVPLYYDRPGRPVETDEPPEEAMTETSGAEAVIEQENE